MAWRVVGGVGFRVKVGGLDFSRETEIVRPELRVCSTLANPHVSSLVDAERDQRAVQQHRRTIAAGLRRPLSHQEQCAPRPCARKVSA